MTPRQFFVTTVALAMIAAGLWWYPHPGTRPAVAAPRPPVVGSDFNGDGYADLALNVVEGTGESADAVVVLYGSRTGLSTTGRQRLLLSDVRRQRTQDVNQPFGRTMATGNFDGDAYADLVLTEFVPRSRGREDVDGVRIVYGSPTGLDPGRTRVWTLTSPGVPRWKGDDDFGWSLAVGDFGRSRHDDLAIDVWSGMTPVGNAGAVVVMYGSGQGLTAAGSQRWTSSTPGVPGVGEEHEQFGDELAAGRFSSSGYDDLAIGISSRRVGGHQLAGAVVVLRGSSSGLTTRGSQLWSQDTPGVRGVAQDNDAFGDSLTVGQFGRGRYEDLAIGVPDETVAGRESAGAVNVLYGSAGGLTARGNQLWTQKGLGIKGIPETQDTFGQALVAANLGHDEDGRLDDLVISVAESVHGVYQAGQVHLLFGRKDGLSTRNSQILTTTNSGLVRTRAMNDLFGDSLATGEFGAPRPAGGAYDDLVLTAPVDDSAREEERAGVQVLYGGPDGPGQGGIQAYSPRLLNERPPTRTIWGLGAENSGATL